MISANPKISSRIFKKTADVITADTNWIARIVLRVMTGHGGVRGFRDLPYRKLRNEWGLRSILRARNQVGKARR